MQLRRGEVAATLAGGLAGALFPFLFAIRAWPEIIVPAYFTTKGAVLGKTIIFMHTPLLILTTALSGSLFGFHATTFRAIAALFLALAGGLIVAGVRRKSNAALVSGLVVGIPYFLLIALYGEEPSLWPDPLLGGVFLGGALLLERYEARGRRRDLYGAALIFGFAILVKQTSAWAGLFALLWLVFRARASNRDRVTFVLLWSAPYAIWVLVWAALYGTWTHVMWTLVFPALTRHAAEIDTPPTLGDFVAAVIPFLIIPAYEVVRRSLPPIGRRFRSALPWIAVGTMGMAFPRWEVQHVSGGFPILAVLAARAALVVALASRRTTLQRVQSRRLSLIVGTSFTAMVLVVIVVSCASLIPFNWRGPALFWDDSVTQRHVADVRAKLRPGDAFLNFNCPFETLYPLTGTTTPSGMYVNPIFWHHLNKLHVGDRIVADLSRRPGTLVLFHDLAPDEDTRARESVLYRFILARTLPLERVSDGCVWRVVLPPPH